MKNAIIRLSGISVGYDKSPILKNISFEISRGTVFVIMGPSGCGKSTLLRAMAGLLKPLRGKIEVASSSVDGDTMRNIGMLFQGGACLPL